MTNGKIRKIYAILVLIALAMPLSGCAESMPKKQELQDVALYTIIAFDKTESGYRITLGGVVPNGQDKLRVYTAEGASLSECMRIFERYPSRQKTMGHLNFALIDEELVRDGLPKIVDMLARAPQIRMSLGIYVISGAKGLDAMEKANTVDRPLDKRLGNLDSAQPYNSVSAPIGLTELLRQMLESKRACLPTVNLVPVQQISPIHKEDEMEVNAAGVTLVDENRMVALLDEELTRGYNLLGTQPFQDYLGLRLSNGLEAEVRILQRESCVKSLWEGETLVGFRVTVQAQGVIEGIYPWESFVDGEQGESVHAIEAASEGILRHLAAKVIQDAQSREIDYLRFEETVRNAHPIRHQKMKDNFDKVFAGLPVEIEVTCELDRSYDLELDMMQEP